MSSNFELSEPRALESLISGAGFRQVAVTREPRQIPFESREDYWATMKAGGGLSGPRTWRCPGDRRVEL